MENETIIIKIKKYKKIIITSVLIAITLSITLYSSIFLLKKINTERYVDYLTNNNFKKQKDNSYLKKDNSNIQYTALFNNIILHKKIYSDKNNDYIVISLSYNKNGNINTELQLDGLNKNNEAGLLRQKGTYKNNKFTCKIISGNNFKTKCNLMKKETITFKKEIKNILKNNKINPKFLIIK